MDHMRGPEQPALVADAVEPVAGKVIGEKEQKLAAERIIKEGLNVRQTEGLVARLQARGGGSRNNSSPITPLTRDAHLASLENQLRERLGTKIHLRYAQGKGALEISFFSDAELERILQILGING